MKKIYILFALIFTITAHAQFVIEQMANMKDAGTVCHYPAYFNISTEGNVVGDPFQKLNYEFEEGSSETGDYLGEETINGKNIDSYYISSKSGNNKEGWEDVSDDTSVQGFDVNFYDEIDDAGEIKFTVKIKTTDGSVYSLK
ncbi:hypothetical protein EDM00_04935 [Ornithobacterium rhinotracheale]|uniref:hypothetical protein n=1 Tax=Ornithobacterium rhinotracheale TaxID=28251 RepID=UPI00129C165E|nr:hypothetical protein [Ornithobacterium rhinotracheale]MRI63340.1 hypothetical protein [Ornithobacterium rhinotracheale]